MKEVQIKFEGEPVPWSAPYVGRKGTFSKKTPLKNKLRVLTKIQYLEKPLEYPLIVDILLFFAIPKSTSKKNIQLMIEGKIRPSKIPDRTNCAKFYEDVLNGIVYTDDRLIVGGKIEKFYSLYPRVHIIVSPVSDS